MEERIKLLEAQVTVLQGTLNKMDQVLGILFQYLLINKQFLDQLQVKLPEQPKDIENKKDEK